MPELRLSRREDSLLFSPRLCRSTRAAFPSRRLRFALFVDNRWRREERDLKTFPRAVILKRFATAFRVLLRATGFGIRRES